MGWAMQTSILEYRIVLALKLTWFYSIYYEVFENASRVVKQPSLIFIFVNVNGRKKCKQPRN